MDNTVLIPLGGSPRGSEVTNPIELIQNFVPIAEAPAIGGQKQLRMKKRRGYQNRLAANPGGFSAPMGMQWTGVPGTGSSSPSTLRGVLVYAKSTAITGLRLYQYDTSESTLGTFGTSNYNCFAMQETLISTTPNVILNIGNVSSPFDQKLLFFPSGGALTEVTDGDFPTDSIGRGVPMDGYYFVATKAGYIHNSDLNSLANWSATSKIAVQMQPDSLVGLARIRNIIVALGTNSIEFFQNAGNTSGSPLTRIAQATLKIGCINGSAVYEYGEGIIFVSNGPEGVGVHWLEGIGAQPKKVSTAFVDTMVADDSKRFGPAAGTILKLGAMGGIVKHHGSAGIPLEIGASTNGGVWMYYPAFDLWTRFLLGASGTISGPFFNAAGANLTTNSNSEVIWHDEESAVATSGNDYNATNMIAFIQTVPMTHGTAHRKIYKSARLIGDQQTVTTPVVLSYSDDDGANFTNAGTFEMSANPIVPLTRLGSSRKRCWKLSNTSAGGCCLDALELTYEVCTN